MEVVGIVMWNDVVAVRRCPSGVAEKRFVFMVFDKLECLIFDEVVGVTSFLAILVCGQLFTCAVSDQVFWIVIVRMDLIVVSIPKVEPELFRDACGSGISKAPFSEASGGIACLFKH